MNPPSTSWPRGHPFLSPHVIAIPSRESPPSRARPLGVRAEGSETLGGRVCWFTGHYWLARHAGSGLWVLWEKKEYWLPVEAVAAVEGVPDREPNLPVFLMSAWPPGLSRRLHGFVPDRDSSYDLGLEHLLPRAPD